MAIMQFINILDEILFIQQEKNKVLVIYQAWQMPTMQQVSLFAVCTEQFYSLS